MANKVTARELQEGKDEYMILDVREADELQEGKIDGAVNIQTKKGKTWGYR
jgi:rhodanese-related sulfurtransferase